MLPGWTSIPASCVGQPRTCGTGCTTGGRRTATTTRRPWPPWSWPRAAHLPCPSPRTWPSWSAPTATPAHAASWGGTSNISATVWVPMPRRVPRPRNTFRDGRRTWPVTPRSIGPNPEIPRWSGTLSTGSTGSITCANHPSRDRTRGVPKRRRPPSCTWWRRPIGKSPPMRRRRRRRRHHHLHHPSWVHWCHWQGWIAFGRCWPRGRRIRRW